jgi:cellulose synthase operon protein C
MKWTLLFLFAVMVSVATMPSRVSAASPVDTCKDLHRRGKLAEAQTCFKGLLSRPDAFLRAEGNWGLQQWQEANTEFRTADKNGPSALVKTEWGNLMLDHYQPEDAAQLFAEALETDPNYVTAYLGMARVAAQRYDKKAPDFAQQALQHDPKLYQAHELLAYLALEDSNTKLATEEAQKAVAISGEALDGMAVLASIDWLDDKMPSPWMERILKVNPAYGEAYATGGHFFEINRRYELAIDYYRKALRLNDTLWSARSQLAENLLRVGNETEAKVQFDRCYEAHYRDAVTKNSLALLDSLNNFETFKTPTTELMLNKKESALLRPYIEPELQRAMATYDRKYHMKLPGPVRLEVYPNHDDFIVRTLGLPGQGGLLGVTFGLVVAMDSPSARPPGSFTWASTMWHELSHVYILTATHHLVPRWFTEGLAVHEEGAASPDWADRLTPEIILALQKKQLLPVLDLDRGFIRPDYPTQVQVSYYQAGQICDFISQKWGDDALLGMVHSYAERQETADAIQNNLHESAAAFDKEFNAWLEKKTGVTVQHFDEWQKGMKSAAVSLKDGKADAAIQEVNAVRGYFPDSGYDLMAEAYLAKNDRAAAIRALETYRNSGGTNVDTLKKLAKLQQDAGNSKQAELTLQTLNYIYPQDEDTHQRLGGLLLASDASGAIREYRAVLALKPGDTAESHYNLAKALQAAHQTNEAKDQVVQALEAAPGFKPAQQLLLQLSQ